MANQFYGTGLANLRPADWVALTWQMMLLKTTATFDINNTVVSDISAHEVSGTGYLPGFSGTGRQGFANRAVAFDGTRWVLSADNAFWGGINVGTIGAMAVIYPVTSDADSILIAWLDSGFPVETDGSDFIVPWSADGIFRNYNAGA